MKKKTTRHSPMHSEPLNSQRVVIEAVSPEIDGGKFPIKRAEGEKVIVRADIFTEGHDKVHAVLLYRKNQETEWRQIPMTSLVNDRWEGIFTIEEGDDYWYTLKAWVDHFATWQEGLLKKWKASVDIHVDILAGINLIEEAIQRSPGKRQQALKRWIKYIKEKRSREEQVPLLLSEDLLEDMKSCSPQDKETLYDKELYVTVDRPKALFSSWYEVFPRSLSAEPGKHGTFKDCQRLLPEIADMGFDVLYLPPIHPIGQTNRKGKNNSTQPQPDSPGSPWAIGSRDGGHKAIHPELGTLKDFQALRESAEELGIELAMDMAFQCSPDHPYVKEHPQWFNWRPDGTIQYAENPPKKYEDIYPINFESEDWENLWEELKSIFIYWIKQGVRIFRVDNPHTKPFLFWDWVIKEIRREYPGIIFLSEAFTRPKVMKRLAKGGFTQSYTYFTWRNTKQEFVQYLTELTKSESREYFRPNFWTNTPDILPEHLQYGGRPAFLMRAVLAATLSSNYGVYGPAFELCVSEAVAGKEEYLNSEKYEIKQWERDASHSLKDFIARLNKIRRDNPALQTTWNLEFCPVENEHLLCFEKTSDDNSNCILVVINMDPYHTQSGWVRVPLERWVIDGRTSFLAHDLLSNDKYIWQGEYNYVELNPGVSPAHILRIHKRLRQEQDFDYFM